MAILTSQSIYEYTDQKLNAHLQNNENFNLELAHAFEFYRDRLLDIVNDNDKDRLEIELFQSIKSQIFNGYYMAMELLSNEKASFSDEWFMQSKGMIAQQMPDMLRKVTNNVDGIITHDSLKTLAYWLVVEYEGVYPLLMDIALNTACMGSKWAFLDEAEKRAICQYQPKYSGLLTFIDEIEFITPQAYISCDISNDSSELWSVVSSKYSGLDKVGEVTLIKSTNNEGFERYYMNISIKNILSISEQQFLIDSLALKLMATKGLERNKLILTAASVEEFYEINNNV